MPETLQTTPPVQITSIAPTGMAKTAPIPVKEEPLEPKLEIQTPPEPIETLSAPSWEGIPVDLIRYFGKDIGTMTTQDIEQMKDIDRWSKTDLTEDTISGRLQKIRNLESRLGAPNLYETKVQKLWTWVRMQFHIDEMRNRQKTFER